MNSTRRKSLFALPLLLCLVTLACIITSIILIDHPRLNMNKKNTISLPQQVTTQPKIYPTVITLATVAKGDDLLTLLKKQHLPSRQIRDIVYGSGFTKQLPPLKVGDPFTFKLGPHHTLLEIDHPINSTTTLKLIRSKNGYHTSRTTIPAVTTTEFKQGTVQHSFGQAALKAGLNQALIKQFRTLFQGKINFNREVSPHDRFAVLYNEFLINGKKDHSGKILMAEYQHHHHHYTAVRFTAPHHQAAYYSWQGRGLEPLYLRVPLHYKRISSKFNLHRLDPILHKYRPHYGVDYAAPTGTPIHSIGAGKIVFIGRDHGYGNAIRIRYSKKYLALYAHLSRFAHLRHGQQVKKGQIIGYVGQTGWATGPHLHFGWYVNGIPRDPLKRATFYNPPITKRNRGRFLAHLHSLQSQWQLFGKNDTNNPANLATHTS